jgi:hypothetical protein
MRNQRNNTSGNQQHHDGGSESNGGQIHNVVIGFEPALWVLNHLDSHLNGKWPTP